MMVQGLLRVGMLATAIAGTGLLTAAAAPHTRERAAPERPVVVELFTAQGCAGCPDANRAIESVSDEPGVIVLTYGVDYWDYLGWADTFARPEFAARQRAYRSAMKLRSVSTPQVVVDGRRHVSGSRAPELQTLIELEARDRGWPPEIEFREAGDRVGVGSGRPPPGGAEVLAVVYRPGLQTVEVGGGDNRGQSVRHLNVVREVRSLGEWTGRPILLNLPVVEGPDDGIVVMIQGKADRHIVSAAARSNQARD